MKLIENAKKANKLSNSPCKIVTNRNEIRLTRQLGQWKENWSAVAYVCLK